MPLVYDPVEKDIKNRKILRNFPLNNHCCAECTSKHIKNKAIRKD